MKLQVVLQLAVIKIGLRTAFIVTLRILQCLVLMKFQNSHIGSYGKEGAMHMSVILSICISVMSVNMNEQNAMFNREWVCFKEDSAFGIYIKLTRTCK